MRRISSARAQVQPFNIQVVHNCHDTSHLLVTNNGYTPFSKISEKYLPTAIYITTPY